MSDVLLTSEAKIKGYSNIDDNISSKFISTAIRESQDTGLQAIIGTRLFKKLKELVSTGDIKNDEYSAYKEVLDISQWYLIYDVLSKLCVIANFKLNNAGVYQSNDINMASVSIEDTFAMVTYYKNKADFYCKRIQEYLIENHSLIKEISNSKITEIRSNLYSSASSGYFLGGARGKRSYKYPTYGYDKEY